MLWPVEMQRPNKLLQFTWLGLAGSQTYTMAECGHFIALTFAFGTTIPTACIPIRVVENAPVHWQKKCLLLAFMKTGNPNGAGLPSWPKFSVEKGETMVLNDVSEVQNDPDRAARAALTNP